MNAITARFAAMAARAAAEESQLASPRKGDGELEAGTLRGKEQPVQHQAGRPLSAWGPGGVPGLRAADVQEPGQPRLASFDVATGQAELDHAVAEELAPLERDEPPPAAPDHFGDAARVTPTTPDARGRAVAYVSNLIGRYVALRRSPYGYKVNITAQIERLRRELGEMQAGTPEGNRLAGRWDFLVGDLV